MAEQYTADRPMPYTPDEGQVRAWCREGTGDYPDVMDEWLDRFLARVRRDAWEEGYDTAAEFYNADVCLAADNPYETGDQA